MRDTQDLSGPTLMNRVGADASRAGLLYTLPGVLLVVFGYAFIHVAARLLASGNLGEDDPSENLLIQTLAPGYDIQQGPLYDWALWALQQVMGTGVHAFLLLKYSLLVGMAGLLFLIAYRVMGSALWAFMAVDALSLVYQIFWRFHEGFTHRVGAMALAVATVWGLLRLVDRGGYRDYALFAILVGLGLLTEHTYAVFLFALLAAALLQPAVRRRVFAAPMLAALPVVVLIVSPYAAWILADPQRTTTFLSGLMPFAPTRTTLGMLHGLRDALTFPVLVLAPYIFILPAVFPGMLKTIARATAIRPGSGDAPDFGQLILHVLLIELGLLVVFDALLFMRSDYAVHSLLPMFIIAIVWLTDKARASAPTAARMRVFVVIMLTLTVIAFLGRAANMFVLDPVCSKCRWGIPYATLVSEMRAHGFQDGTVITSEKELGGNLRRFFPTARFVIAGHDIAPPATEHNDTGRMAIVWSAKPDDPVVPPQLLTHLPRQSEPWQPILLAAPWRHLWKADGYRYSNWQFIIVNQTSTR